ncbi:MAG: transcriptional regulator [Rhizomicrobium sp.]|jgi:putative transcriptional regulator
MKAKKKTTTAARNKKRNHVYEGIRAGLEDAVAYARGTADLSQYKVHIPEDLDVKAIRKGTGLTQEIFALRYGFNLARLRDLEQKRTRPDSVVRAYLLVIRKNPKAVKDALAA